MKLLTEQEAKEFLEHPFIKFDAVARACFPGDRIAEQKLRGRVYNPNVKALSKDTLTRITKVAKSFYHEITHDIFLNELT